MPIPPEDIQHRFRHHPPRSEEMKLAHSNVRFACREAAKLFLATVPPGREQSLAITKLEEAMMWANAGIAREKPMDLATAPNVTSVTAKP